MPLLGQTLQEIAAGSGPVRSSNPLRPPQQEGPWHSATAPLEHDCSHANQLRWGCAWLHTAPAPQPHSSCCPISHRHTLINGSRCNLLQAALCGAQPGSVLRPAGPCLPASPTLKQSAGAWLIALLSAHRGKGVGGSTGGTEGRKALIQRPTSSTAEDSTVPEGVV